MSPVFLLLTLHLIGCGMCVTVPQTSKDAWRKQAQDDLDTILGQKPNTNVAKNVIFFLGDGMGVSTVTAGRIYKGQMEGKSGEETVLSFEKFPNVALSKTYNVDRQTADSAGTATAFLCGVKANFGTVGVDETVKRLDCEAEGQGKVTSILKWSLDEGKSAGIVTTARVTHATPAAGYAHSADRDWEGDLEIAKKGHTGKCKDIAQQLVDNLDLTVILGGGRRFFLLNNQSDPETGKVETKYHRADGRDLIKEWLLKKSYGGKKASYVWKKSQFDSVDPKNTDYLLGLFGSDHMEYDIERDNSGDGEPSLADLTKKAIEMLKKNKKGYFLLVEAGRIDHGHHDNEAKRALHDVVALDKAVATAVEMTSDDDTLLVVTADHSHVFNIGGYPKRGNGIFDKVDNESISANERPYDNLPKTSLIYGNGPGAAREDITDIDTTGRIDHGHHDNEAKRALHDVVALDKAVATAVEMTSDDDTLLVVTADHSHVFNIGGYPFRGTGILDKVANESMTESTRPYDNLPKTTLVYGNGPGVPREDLTNIDTTHVDYQFANAVQSESETHGGEDVSIYAHGPMAHLFSGVREQNYIAHAMAYASCVGQNKNHCNGATSESQRSVPLIHVLLTGLFVCLGHRFLPPLCRSRL